LNEGAFPQAGSSPRLWEGACLRTTKPAAAKAWMGSEQYAQLKALLLSVKYS
jgi:hypothetical protein